MTRTTEELLKDIKTSEGEFNYNIYVECLLLVLKASDEAAKLRKKTITYVDASELAERKKRALAYDFEQ